MTKRITTTPAVVQRLEAVSPTTTIQWDPATETGSVIFEVWDMVYENDVYVGMVRNTEIPTIEASIEQLSARMVAVDMGGPEPSLIPVLLVSPILRKLFDELYNERALGPVDDAAPSVPRIVRGQRPR